MKNIKIIVIIVIVLVMIIYFYFNNVKNAKTNNINMDYVEILHTDDNIHELLEQEAEMNGYVNLSNYPGLLEKTIKRDKNIDPDEREMPMYIYERGRLGIYHPEVDHYHMAFKAITGNSIDTFYSSISGNDII